MATQDDSVSLKEFITDKFETLEKTTEFARQSMEKRLDQMNEFRQQLKDQNASFITRIEYEAKHEAKHETSIEKIGALEKIVYIGLGICLAAEVILGLVIK